MKMDEKEFVDVLSRPVKESSLFYGYYYLSEVEGVEDVEFDLKKKTDELKQAFWNYSIYVTVLECANFRMRVHFDKQLFREVLTGLDVRIKRDSWIDKDKIRLSDIGRYVRGPRARKMVQVKCIEAQTDTNTPMDIMELSRLIEDSGIVRPASRAEMKENVEILKNKFEVYDRPRDFLRTAEVMFSEFNWTGAFGGDMWAGICKATLEKGNVPDVMWVDMMWSLEHNNQNWLSKIFWNESEDYIDESVDMLSDAVVNRLKQRSLGPLDTIQVLLFILDEKKEGNFDRIYPFIVNADGKLRRYKSHFM